MVQLQRNCSLLQCNLGHNTLNALRKVGRYVMQVRVFSSILMQECVFVCVYVCMGITHAFACSFFFLCVCESE